MKVKQYLSKVLTLGLAITCLITTTIASEGKKVLTLERAVSGGIDNEEKIGVIEKQIKAAEETLWMTSNIGSSIYQTTKINRDSLIQEKDFVKDIVTYNVTKLYQNIIYIQKEMQLNDIQVSLAEKALKQVEIKNTKGLASTLELATAKARLKEAESAKVQSETNLADYKSQFLRLTNINIDNYDELENNMMYEALEYKGGVNSLITHNVDLYMESQDRLTEYKKNNILTIAEENSGGFAPGSVTVYSSEADAAATEYSAKKTREQMINSLNTCYANLQTLQETLKMLELKQANSKQTYEAAKIKYAHGYISELELKNNELSMLQEALQYDSTLLNYIQGKMYLEKPWVR